MTGPARNGEGARKGAERRRAARARLMKPPPPRGARGRAATTVERLSELYPAACELDHQGPFQLLVATILSAQTTDRRVNEVTPALFRRYPSAAALAAAEPAAVEEMIRPTGFFRAKTRSLISCAVALVERFGGEVPRTMEELVTLPGIGRKTANVVLGVAFDIPGFPVDTHVNRLANRLRLVATREPERVEAQVCAMVPAREWTGLSLRLILHGRRVCLARRPRCEGCPLNDYCPSSTVRPGRP
ncbi:MAG: endonuclease III [Candidatus Dormibacterales bacterium]